MKSLPLLGETGARQRGLASALAAASLMGALYLLLAYALYTNVASVTPGANDFYSRWAGARALLLHGENPYGESTTREIQVAMYGRPARSGEDQVAFAYPLYSAFAVWPLVYFPYAQAQALWMALLVLAVGGGSLVLFKTGRAVAEPVLLIGLLLGVLVFYPSVRGIFLGQFALLAFLFLALALAAANAGMDLAAGACLALALVKPQPGVLLVPVVLLWAARHRRWRIVVSALGVLLGLGLLAMMWVPAWPLDFLRAIGRYAEYEPVGPPLQTAIEWLAPNEWAGAFTLLGSGILLVGLVWLVLMRLASDWQGFQPAIQLSAIVTTLMAGRVGTPDQIILLIPWLAWLRLWLDKGSRPTAFVAVVALLLAPWGLFLATLKGNAENVAVTLVLPFLSLVVFLWQQWEQRR